LTLLDSEVSIRLDEKAREEVISALADLLLEALGGASGKSEGVENEFEN
jgi:hypothetical protein